MRPKILIVDDEKAVRELVSATLNSNQCYQLFEAQDGEDAMDIALKERPDLVILDILMPGVDGFEVCKRLRAVSAIADVSIIMLTALAQKADKELSLHSGANAFFTKPFSPTQLVKKTDELLRAREKPSGRASREHDKLTNHADRRSLS